MSDAQKPMADVLAAHRWSPAKNDMRGGCYGCAYHGDYAGWIAHVTPEIDAALGGLRSQACHDMPAYAGTRRWVSGWSEVQL